MINAASSSPRQTVRGATARIPQQRVIGDRSGVPVSDDVVAYLAGYTPRGVAAGHADWAKGLVLASHPASRLDARVLCRRCCDLAAWLVNVGYDLATPVETLLSDAVIDAYLRKTQRNPGTAQTMRSAFRRVRRAVTQERKIVYAGGRTDVDSAVRPVDTAEAHRFLSWINGIDDQHALRHDGLTLVALIRGAGCTRPDLDHIDVATFRAAPGGRLTLDIAGAMPRTVTVERPWAQHLQAAHKRVGSGSPFDLDGAHRKGSQRLKNLEGYYYRQQARLDPAHHKALPGFLNLNTYRAAWLVERLNSGVRLDRLLREAGLRSAASLDRYLQYLPDTCAPRTAR